MAAALPAWDDLKRDYLDPGVPHRLVVRTSPGILIFTDEAAARLGARFELAPTAPATPPSTLAQIAVTDVTAEGRRWMEIGTAAPRLYESFYRFIGQVSGAVLGGMDAHEALARAVELWDTLVAQTAVLSEERQAGLFGELVLLERLLDGSIEEAVSAWVGPDRQAHDFRSGDVEFEVKTTSSARRTHTINGVGQLAPSPGSLLYLVSIQLADAGSGGRSLPELVDALRERIDVGARPAFEAKLEAAAYAERHRGHYVSRRRLRTPMALIPVVDDVPRLTPDALLALPAGYAAGRIEAVTYDIDVTGLGDLDGSIEFLSVILAAKGPAA